MALSTVHCHSTQGDSDVSLVSAQCLKSPRSSTLWFVGHPAISPQNQNLVWVKNKSEDRLPRWDLGALCRGASRGRIGYALRAQGKEGGTKDRALGQNLEGEHRACRKT